MKYLDCPLLGLRPQAEFVIRGVLAPEPADLGERSAGSWVFDRHSVPGERVEWWYHTPSRLWFQVTRHTGSDAVLGVELAQGPR